jgi:hypothetical protein
MNPTSELLDFDKTVIAKQFPLKGLCVACKPGFYLNNALFCEKIEVLYAEKDNLMEHLTNQFFV